MKDGGGTEGKGCSTKLSSGPGPGPAPDRALSAIGPGTAVDEPWRRCSSANTIFR